MKKILIIEDEKMLREMYTKKFTEEGFNVIAAPDAEKGVALVKKEMPDLILLDILLPKRSGLQALEQVRNNEQTNHIKVVAFSNYDDATARASAKKLQVLAYLLKTSFTPTEIVEEVKKYL